MSLPWAPFYRGLDHINTDYFRDRDYGTIIHNHEPFILVNFTAVPVTVTRRLF